MKKKLQIALLVFMLAVFAVSVSILVYSRLEYKWGNDIYEDAIENYVSVLPVPQLPAESASAASQQQQQNQSAPSPSQKAADQPLSLIMSADALVVDFDGLRSVNSDVCAWIVIERTPVSYPILQGRDNSKYLYLAFDESETKLGSIFMDYRCLNDYSQRNTIIYGHNMKDGSMFAPLLDYAQQEFYDTHRYFHIITETGTLKYEVFSAYKLNLYGNNTFKLEFEDDAEYLEYIERLKYSSSINSGVEIGTEDLIVTLATCADAGQSNRFVVHGRLVNDGRAVPDTPEYET